MAHEDEQRFKYLRQGRDPLKQLPIVTRLRGGVWRAWLDGRGFVVGFGKTEKESINALRSLLS